MRIIEKEPKNIMKFENLLSPSNFFPSSSVEYPASSYPFLGLPPELLFGLSYFY
jgi:hypothetical protein